MNYLMKATPYNFSVFALVFVTLIGLSGCGQSGPLYLPEAQQQKNQPQSSTKPKRETTAKQSEGEDGLL